VKAAGTAAFTTSANDWTAFGWPAPAAQPAVTPSADLAATADAATGQGYSWALEDLPYRLVSEVTILAPVRVVAIDVNPGSDAGACGRVRATIPVAVLGAPDLDVAAVDVASVALEGMPVARTGNGRLRASYEDVNGDGAVDLLASIANTRSLSGTIPVRLTGTLVDGTPVEGTDVLCGP
jgi:hypothetical protein